jgi:hypothetical protein
VCQRFAIGLEILCSCSPTALTNQFLIDILTVRVLAAHVVHSDVGRAVSRTMREVDVLLCHFESKAHRVS